MPTKTEKQVGFSLRRRACSRPPPPRVSQSTWRPRGAAACSPPCPAKRSRAKRLVSQHQPRDGVRTGRFNSKHGSGAESNGAESKRKQQAPAAKRRRATHGMAPIGRADAENGRDGRTNRGCVAGFGQVLSHLRGLARTRFANHDKNLVVVHSLWSAQHSRVDQMADERAPPAHA